MNREFHYCLKKHKRAYKSKDPIFDQILLIKIIQITVAHFATSNEYLKQALVLLPNLKDEIYKYYDEFEGLAQKYLDKIAETKSEINILTQQIDGQLKQLGVVKH